MRNQEAAESLRNLKAPEVSGLLYLKQHAIVKINLTGAMAVTSEGFQLRDKVSTESSSSVEEGKCFYLTQTIHKSVNIDHQECFACITSTPFAYTHIITYSSTPPMRFVVLL